ncbi:MAG TPA: TIGR00159 family protein [Chloroflexi bacterium]|nr:TIGR00159 family protein [Chloroflexota bacterium]
MITLIRQLGRTLSMAANSPLFWLDTLLVAVVLFFVLRLLGRSPARVLARGALLAVFVLLLLVLLRPFPALSLLARGALLAILVATPVLFQAELRRMLEELGRVGGRGGASHAEVTGGIVPALMRAIERLSADKTGALIVLEGEVPLDVIVETGVRLNAEVSSELLEAIFYPNNPLHDGAAVLRGSRVRAAACVLPLTERRLGRLGTRHRAALGLSEQSDALTLVVSEERGAVSLAQDGVLQYNKDLATVRTALLAWYESRTEGAGQQPGSLCALIGGHDRQWWIRLLGTAALAFGLALLIAVLVHVPGVITEVGLP